jgi:PrtD family type I secretion system ABC transporter
MDGQRAFLHSVLRRLAGGFAAALVIGGFLGLLMLAVPLYSMQLFDRVLTSGHSTTLLLLSLVLVLCMVTFGLLEMVRTCLLARLGTRLAGDLEARLVATAARGRETSELTGALATLRHCLTGPVAQALGDAPWLPLAIAILWLVHPSLGWLGLGSAACLAGLTVLADRLTLELETAVGAAGAEARRLLDAVTAAGPAVGALGMLPALEQYHRRASIAGLAARQRAAERAGIMLGAIRALRLLVQGAVLGLGAWLVLERQITPGTMLGTSILLARALAPIEQLVAAWKPLGQARQALATVRRELALPPPSTRRPEPGESRGSVRLEAVGLAAPDGRPILADIDLELRPGEVMGVIGASGAGKSSLCRLLAGAASPTVGTIRRGGTDRDLLDPSALGALTGYVSQEPRFFPGTIAVNIARQQATAPFAAIAAAARVAGVHETIQRLTLGYETPLDAAGAPLSGGERQRLAIARAIYGSPALVVLDEPDAHQDAAGGAALARLITELRQAGTMVVLATHRPGLITLADRVLVLEAGRITALRPRADVARSLVAAPRAAA